MSRTILQAPPEAIDDGTILPHGAKPMWVSIEEWLLVQHREFCRYYRRSKRQPALEDYSEWIDNWYRGRGPGVLVDHGDQGILLYQLISAYPEDRALIKERRERKKR